MARRERTEATVRRAARRLRARTEPRADGGAASAVTRTSTVAECAEGGWRVANGVRQAPRGQEGGAARKRLPRLVEWV
jgi:hypothetical protein